MPYSHAGKSYFNRIFRFVQLLALVPYLRTYLHVPWSTVILKKLTVSQLVKKFLAFYGTRRFINAFTSARHLFLF